MARDQHLQNLEWLLAKKVFWGSAFAPDGVQLTRVQVEFEPSEPYTTCETVLHGHQERLPTKATVSKIIFSWQPTINDLQAEHLE
jgi:hypothetical protein